MSEFEEQEQKRLRVERRVMEAKQGLPVGDHAKIENLKNSLPYFMNDPALSTVKKVLEMVQAKLETSEQLTEFQHTLDSLHSYIEETTKTGQSLNSKVSELETSIKNVVELLTQHVSDNQKTNEELIKYLKSWS